MLILMLVEHGVATGPAAFVDEESCGQNTSLEAGLHVASKVDPEFDTRCQGWPWIAQNLDDCTHLKPVLFLALSVSFKIDTELHGQ